jgi:hypothetical protein
MRGVMDLQRLPTFASLAPTKIWRGSVMSQRPNMVQQNNLAVAPGGRIHSFGQQCVARLQHRWGRQNDWHGYDKPPIGVI